MSLTIQCPRCAQRYQVKGDRAGKQVRCQKCATTFVATGSDPAAAAPAPLDPLAGIDLASFPTLDASSPLRSAANPLGPPVAPAPSSFSSLQRGAANCEISNPSGGPTDLGMRLGSAGMLGLGFALLGFNFVSNSLQGAMYLAPLLLAPLLILLGVAGLISPNVIRGGGKFGTHLPWHNKAAFYGLLGVWFIIAIALAVGLMASGYRGEP